MFGHNKCMVFDCASVKSNFISPNEHPKQYPRVKMQVLVFMSEIKFDLTLKKYIFCFFMLLFTIIKLVPTLRLSRQKTNFFLAISRRFGLVQCV